MHTLFLENEAQINRNNPGKMFFMSRQDHLLKISSILQEMKMQLFSEKWVGKDCMVTLKKKKLRNGTLDCLGDEAKFPHVFSFFCLSFSFVSLSKACPRVTITIVPNYLAGFNENEKIDA